MPDIRYSVVASVTEHHFSSEGEFFEERGGDVIAWFDTMEEAVAHVRSLPSWSTFNTEGETELTEVVEQPDAILGYDVGSQTFCKACAPRSVVGTPLKPGEWFICGTCSDVYGDMPGKAP